MSEVQTSTGRAGEAAGGGYGKPPAGEPRALVVGHLTEDRTPDGPRLGGAAAYAGLLLARWGVSVEVLTAADAGFPFLWALGEVSLTRIESPSRTRFENRYLPDGSRHQRLLSRAGPIPAGAVREATRRLPTSSLVVFAPVISELSGVGALPWPAGPGAFAAAIPQGMLRRVDPRTRAVTLAGGDGLLARLDHLDLLCFGEEESRAAGVRAWLAAGPAGTGPLVAVTRGAEGAALFRRGAPETPVPALEASPTDPTGAGDVFAAALAFGLWRGEAPAAAARLAAAAAALTVESAGTGGIPTRAEAAARAALSNQRKPSGGEGRSA